MNNHRLRGPQKTSVGRRRWMALVWALGLGWVSPDGSGASVEGGESHWVATSWRGAEVDIQSNCAVRIQRLSHGRGSVVVTISPADIDPCRAREGPATGQTRPMVRSSGPQIVRVDKIPEN